MAVLICADSQGSSLRLAQAASKLGQVLLPAGRLAQHRQQIKGQQRPERVRLDATAVIGHRLELLGDGLDLLNGMARPGARLGLNHGQSRLEMLGLQTAAGVASERAYEQAFRFVVFDVIVALTTTQPSVWPSSFHPLAV